ncbi:MAG: hypothetical protein K9G41_01960 [Flavobacteriales bacterium]|nr:hypothetical protein [Flavobacteriales bacterium]
MLRYAIGLVALLTIFSSCESDFKLTGEYEEKPLIYGLLDPLDNPNAGGDGHLFRIQKAFLGEESAFVMALEPDSSYFRYEDLFVELIEYNGSTESNRWVLDTVMIANKDTGNPDDDVIDFFGPFQRLYKLNQNIRADRDYEVTLKKRPVNIPIGAMTIANMDTVTPIADSKTAIVDVSTLSFSRPSQNSGVSSSQRITLVNASRDYVNYILNFSSAERGKQYEVWMRFYYRELKGGVETLKSIRWLVQTIEVGTEGLIQVPVLSENFYSRIGSVVAQEAGVIRKIGRADGTLGDPFQEGLTQDLDLEVLIAGEELFAYIDINNPTNSTVLQDKPVYTNINNGLGVFSSRSKVEFVNKLHLSVESALELVDGQYTKELGFVIDPN